MPIGYRNWRSIRLPHRQTKSRAEVASCDRIRVALASDTATIAHQAHLECRYRFSRSGILEMKRPFERFSRTDLVDWIACSFGWGVPVSECGEHPYPLSVITASVFSFLDLRIYCIILLSINFVNTCLLA